MSDDTDAAPEDSENGPFFRLLKWISVAGAAAGGAALIAITLIVAYDVIARFIGYPTLWATEVAGYLLIAVGILGAGEALRRNEHFAMTLLIDAVRPSVRFWMSLVVWGALLLVAAGLVLGSVDLLANSLRFGLRSYTILRFPLAIPQALLLAGFAILTVALLVRVVALLRRVPASKE